MTTVYASVLVKATDEDDAIAVIEALDLPVISVVVASERTVWVSVRLDDLSPGANLEAIEGRLALTLKSPRVLDFTIENYATLFEADARFLATLVLEHVGDLGKDQGRMTKLAHRISDSRLLVRP